MTTRQLRDVIDERVTAWLDRKREHGEISPDVDPVEIRHVHAETIDQVIRVIEHDDGFRQKMLSGSRGEAAHVIDSYFTLVEAIDCGDKDVD
jgi:hypothetical protein